MKRLHLAIALLLLTLSSQAKTASDLSGPPQPPGFLEKSSAPVPVQISPGAIVLTAREIDSLIYPGPEPVLRLPSLDRFTGNASTPLEFTRIRLFTPDARLRVLSDQGEVLLAPDSRQFYLATSTTTGVGIAVDSQTGETTGFVNRQGSKLEIRGNIISQLQLMAIDEPPDGSSSCETGISGQPVEIQQKLEGPSFVSVSGAESGEIISYQAVVAVDTDNEWLNQFSNNTSTAMNWITNAFLAMNVFYERDVETRLMIGDVTLRTGTDPYTVQSDRSAQLDEFGAYWKENMSHVERQFAMMLSGRDIPNGYFSGIAWIDQFCEYGRTWGSRTVGSFSYNAIGKGRTPGNTAIYLGHELGHNMGSPHTHCYNPPVDHCYNGGSGCYSGDPECPAGGKGTIMSYCHVGGSNGAGCGTSNSEFHPIVQSLIESNLSVELAAGCILPFLEVVPEPEFDSAPSADSRLDFGTREVGVPGPLLEIQVSNTGEANLAISCDIAGPDAASFLVGGCPLNLPVGDSADISTACLPAQNGGLSATLELTTNDPDEGTVLFDLVCTGVEPPDLDMIFFQGFEKTP